MKVSVYLASSCRSLYFLICRSYREVIATCKEVSFHVKESGVIANYAKDPDKLPPTPTGRSWDRKMVGCAIESLVVCEVK